HTVPVIGGCLTSIKKGKQGVFAFIVKRFRVFRAPLHRLRLATWLAEPGHTATPAGSISTPVDQIAAVQVVAADTGQVLLQRSL
ncbi:hypothetical protein ABLO16_19720, partial [Mycobacterium tuberculosis]